MAASFTAGSSNYLTASTVVTVEPFTLVCWFNLNDVTTNYTLMSVGNSTSTNNNWQLQAAGAVSGDPVRAITANGALTLAASTAGYTAGTWYHAAATFGSDSHREVFLNGGNNASGTVTRAAVSGIVNMSIGRKETSDASQKQYPDGLIAEAAIYDVQLTNEEIGILAKGISPRKVRRANLVAYLPLIRPVVDEMGSSWTNNGTSPADHCRVYCGGGPKYCGG